MWDEPRGLVVQGVGEGGRPAPLRVYKPWVVAGRAAEAAAPGRRSGPRGARPGRPGTGAAARDAASRRGAAFAFPVCGAEKAKTC